MNFSETILERLGHLFAKYDIVVIEIRDNYLYLKSKCLTITICHNQLENSNSVFINRNHINAIIIELTNEIINAFFLNLKLEDVPLKTFVDNLSLFFENEGKPLLKCDLNKIKELEQFSLNRNRIYTSQILTRQVLSEADKAWREKDYVAFINILDKADKKFVPLSYNQKYNIARKKTID